MNYEKLLLKLANDLVTLEEKNEKMESKLQKLEDSLSNIINRDNALVEEKSKEKKNDFKDKLFSKDQTIGLIASKGAREDINIQKASMNEGGGVISNYQHKISKKVMLKSSRNYAHEDDSLEFRGWHTLFLNALESYDAFIFTIEYGKDIELFIFTQEELKLYVSDKDISKSNGEDIYHFYFSKKNDELIDFRGNPKSINHYHNNWDALKSI